MMPLDAKLWKIIEDRVGAEAPDGTEEKGQFLARLRRVALGLPRAIVRNAIDRAPQVLSAINDAKAFHPKND